MWIINCYKSDIGRAFSGQVLDNILQAENERLTEERNQLQLNIRQMEDKISTLEGQITAAVTTVFTVAAAADVLLLIMMTTYNHHHHHHHHHHYHSGLGRVPEEDCWCERLCRPSGSVAWWLVCWTCRQQVAGSNPSRCAFRCNPGRVVHIHVPLSPSSVIWYRPVGGDARRLAR